MPQVLQGELPGGPKVMVLRPVDAVFAAQALPNKNHMKERDRWLNSARVI
jgi:hypothetical protein